MRTLWLFVCALLVIVFAVGAQADEITGVNVSGRSYDVYRFGIQNLTGQTPSTVSPYTTSKDGWMCGMSTFSDENWILFDLNGLVNLTEMRVQNYPFTGDDFPARSMATAPIEYSTDGITWTTLGGTVQTFDQYVNSTTWQSFSFGAGVDARLVRIGSPTTGYTNAGSTWGIGMKIVKFFGDRADEPLVSAITGVTATASGSYDGSSGPEKTVTATELRTDIDGDGIEGQELSTDAGGSHTMGYNGWRSANAAGQWIQWDLGNVVALDHMLLWNYNGDANHDVKRAVVSYSTDGSNWTTLGTTYFTPVQATAWEDYEWARDFNEQNGNINFGGVDARYVKFTDMVGMDDGNMVAIGEVRFFEGESVPAPEPCTLVLVSLGGVGLAGLSRRRRAS